MPSRSRSRSITNQCVPTTPKIRASSVPLNPIYTIHRKITPADALINDFVPPDCNISSNLSSSGVSSTPAPSPSGAGGGAGGGGGPVFNPKLLEEIKEKLENLETLLGRPVFEKCNLDQVHKEVSATSNKAQILEEIKKIPAEIKALTNAITALKGEVSPLQLPGDGSGIILPPGTDLKSVIEQIEQIAIKTVKPYNKIPEKQEKIWRTLLAIEKELTKSNDEDNEVDEIHILSSQQKYTEAEYSNSILLVNQPLMIYKFNYSAAGENYVTTRYCDKVSIPGNKIKKILSVVQDSSKSDSAGIKFLYQKLSKCFSAMKVESVVNNMTGIVSLTENNSLGPENIQSKLESMFNTDDLNLILVVPDFGNFPFEFVYKQDPKEDKKNIILICTCFVNEDDRINIVNNIAVDSPFSKFQEEIQRLKLDSNYNINFENFIDGLNFYFVFKSQTEFLYNFIDAKAEVTSWIPADKGILTDDSSDSDNLN